MAKQVKKSEGDIFITENIKAAIEYGEVIVSQDITSLIPRSSRKVIVTLHNCHVQICERPG